MLYAMPRHDVDAAEAADAPMLLMPLILPLMMTFLSTPPLSLRRFFAISFFAMALMLLRLRSALMPPPADDAAVLLAMRRHADEAADADDAYAMPILLRFADDD